MTAESENLLRRILILAPVGRDADVTRTALERAGLSSLVTADMNELSREIDRGCGAVIVTAEALDSASREVLRATLERQPQWSELPVMVFLTEPAGDRAGAILDLPRALITLMDRPIHLRSLVSAVASALRSRFRQYEVRDLLGKVQQAYQSERQHAQRLTALAEASLSIASALSLPEMLKMITEQARKIVGANLAVTRVVVDLENNKTITSVSYSETYHAWEGYFRDRTGDADEIAELILAPVRKDAASADPGLLRSIFEQSELRPPVRGLLAAPLVEREARNVGFIALSNKYQGEFSPQDEAVLVQLAQMASAAIQNARLYREAQEANKAKDDFLATLAHELRTPMTAILGWVQMLKDKGLPPEAMDSAIQMIEASTRVQSTLVEDLMDVSRIIAGKLKISPQPVELAPLIETVVSNFTPAAQERRLRLTTRFDLVPLSVWGDPTRLQQIVWNLLSNAIKFTPERGAVQLETRRQDGSAVISVKDTGEGIPSDFLPHVFERFRQAEIGAARKHAGLGLGLAIVRHLVEMHGGGIQVYSEGPGKGAEFTVRLPLAVVRPLATPPHPSEFPRLDGRRILVVDDDEEARRILVDVLRQTGIDARAVGSVSEALETLRSFDADLVISDISMPGEDGYALIRRLRQLEEEVGKEIPALALTGYGRPEDRMRILRSGFDRYVQKPVDAAELAQFAADLIPTGSDQ